MRIIPIIIAALLAVGIVSPASAHDRRGPAYHGNDGYLDRTAAPGYWGRDRRDRGIVVRGVRLPRHLEVSRRVRLDPWLADTWEGRTFVRQHYHVTRWNTIDEDDAENANVFFRRWADHNRDYRLTDAEIRTALDHIANGYGLPDSPRRYGHHGRPRMHYRPVEHRYEDCNRCRRPRHHYRRHHREPIYREPVEELPFIEEYQRERG